LKILLLPKFFTMKEATSHFDINFNGKVLKVKEVLMGKDKLYVVSGEDMPPLGLTLAMAHGGGKFWTSMPEGRQQEAEDIGPLIDEYFKNTNNHTSCVTSTASKSVTKLSLFD